MDFVLIVHLQILYSTPFLWTTSILIQKVRKKTSSLQFPVFTKHPICPVQSTLILRVGTESSSRTGVWPETGLRPWVLPSS